MLDDTKAPWSGGFLGPYLIQGPILSLFAEQTLISHRYPEISTLKVAVTKILRARKKKISDFS